MIPVLTKEQAYQLDKDTIEREHLSQEELMDNAGKAVAQFFCEKIKNHVPDLHIASAEIGEDPDKRDYMVSNEKIEALGWKPHHSIDDGIRELIKVYSFLEVNPHNNL